VSKEVSKQPAGLLRTGFADYQVIEPEQQCGIDGMRCNEFGL